VTRRRWYGLPILFTGAALVAVELAWTTRDPAGPSHPSPQLLNVAIFLLGLGGLLLIYLGFRLLAGK
jgi:hypothetical protein